MKQHQQMMVYYFFICATNTTWEYFLGETWETPYSFQLPNPNVAIQANTITNNGPIVLLFNDYNGQNMGPKGDSD